MRGVRGTTAPARIWSLDLETTGLDRRHARMLAVGMVPIDHGAIVLREAFSTLVDPSMPVPQPALVGGPPELPDRPNDDEFEGRPGGGRADRPHADGHDASAAILGIEAHHVRPIDLAGAPWLAQVLRAVLARLVDGDALLVHHAPLDLAVLRRACAEVGEPWPDLPVIDTLRRIVRVNTRRALIGSSAFPTDLAGARAALGLPPHRSHDPLADAIATAELHLALTTRGW